MAKLGYARTSTDRQEAGFEDQLARLKVEGCKPIFKEQVNALSDRQELNRAIAYARDNDLFVVTKLDRLARSVRHLCGIVATLKEKGVTLQILDMNLDTSTPTGELMVNLLGSIGQFVRSLLLERQRTAIARAKAAGKHKGRAETARIRAPEVVRLIKAGMKHDAVAKHLKISRASVYRILKEQGIRKVYMDTAPAEVPVAPVARKRAAPGKVEERI